MVSAVLPKRCLLLKMETSEILEIVLALTGIPTAPFREEGVRRCILGYLSQLSHVSVAVDDFGNVLARFQRGEGVPLWMMSAHMDHPAYVRGVFEGGVPQRVLEKNFPVVSHGDFAVWELTEPAVEEGVIWAPACDDLIGCAAMVATLVDLERSGAEAAVYAAFTCAEEVGLLGAAYLARSGAIPAGVAALSLETSAQNAVCPMHGGVVVRVGDRTSTFDSALTARLWSLAQDQKIRSQRGLMSGGTCEGTAYQVYGVPAAAVCVPLGNYHNCTPEGEIGPEFVSVSDVEALVALCGAVARDGSKGSPLDAVRERIESRLMKALEARGQ
jgi:putative aminopeptidase FrvX